MVVNWEEHYHQCKLQRVKTILGTSRSSMQQLLAGSTGHGLVRCHSTTVHTCCVSDKKKRTLYNHSTRMGMGTCGSINLGLWV